MKAKHSVWKNKLAKTMFLMTVVLVAALFLGSAASAGLRPAETKKKQNTAPFTALDPENKIYPTRVDGLAPKVTGEYNPSQQSTLDRGYFYAYCAVGGPGEGPVTFDTPDAITLLAAGILPNFLGGADMESDVGSGTWYGMDYAGGLYEIDRDTGAQTYLFPTSIGANGMTYDGTTDTWYVSYSNNLYTMDVTTGTSTLIGAHGITNTIIGLACNLDGDMFAYDVLFTGHSTLYSIDKSTGAATAIGDMGYGMVYAQDCGFDRDNDVLYIAAYFNDGSPSQLMTCDIGTGACTPVGPFQGGAEIDGFAVPWLGAQFEHDIAISSIVQPATENAAPITPVVKVKNAGNNTEYDVDIQLEIAKETILGNVEDFEADDGGYTEMIMTNGAWQWGTPTSGPGDAHSGNNCWATNLAGPYPASMWTRLTSPEILVPSGYEFSFWHWYYFENNYDGGNVKISNDGGSTWALITPNGGYPGSMPSNPYLPGEPAYNGNSGTWKKAVFDLSAYEGQLVKIRFEAASDTSVQYDGWYIDDVGFTAVQWVPDYTPAIETIPVIDPDETIEVSFPLWTPSDLTVEEDVDINYNAEATSLFADDNVNNDYKAKEFTLHFGYFNDVKVNEIISPVSGPAESQIPEVAIENVGQLDQIATVDMVISKIEYGDQWTQEAAGEWQQTNTNNAGGTPPEAYLPYSSIQGDYAYLMSPPIDTSGESTLSLSFRSMINNYAGGYNCNVKIRAHPSDDWTDVSPWTNPIQASIPAALYTIDVTDMISTETQVMFEFDGYYFNLNYWYIDDFDLQVYSTDFSGTFPPVEMSYIPEYEESATTPIAAGETVNVSLPEWFPTDLPVLMNIDYFAEVEVTLGGFVSSYQYGFEEAWIPANPFPAGWMTYNENGDSVVWQTSASYPRTGSYSAYISWAAPSDDDWLVSPPVTVPGGGGIYEFWYRVASTSYAEHFLVYYSTSGNTIADFTGPNGYVIGDITFNADLVYHQFAYTMSNPGQVWFAVYCDSADALGLYIDDMSFPDGSFEGFEGAGTAGHWPSFNQYVYGTTTDQWMSVTSGTSPTCSVPEGTYMAKYNSYSISSGNSAELDGTVAIDFTTATLMTFQMYHDTGYAGNGEVIYPLLSADGVNFWYDGTGFYRYDGTTGWKTETMDYSFLIDYLGGPGYYYIGFYAESDFGNNMYMDDINVGTLGVIDDGNPSDNYLSKQFTLSYEHDVGVITITEPHESAPEAKADAWLQYDNGVYANSMGSTTGEMWGANRFTIDELTPYIGWELDTIMWRHYDDTSISGTIEIYGPGTTTTPGALITSEPFTNDGEGWFNITLSNPVLITGEDLWLCNHNTHGTSPQEHPMECSSPGILTKTGFFSSDGTTWYDLVGLGYDLAYMLRGHVTEGGSGPGGNWLPGTYPVEGIVQNIGVTYPEADIPVNAQITNDTGVIVYDETIVIAGPLAPGQTALAVFPNITIPSEPDAEGDYKLTMQTQLPGDDHPNNDKATLTWIIQIPDTTPPITDATLAGTMGDNGWYISDVTVTLTATDGKWPLGVNHTYYKIDDGDWTEYDVPFEVTEDGEHTVYYYSDDKAVPPNVEDEKSIDFKIDQTAPVISEFTATAQNALKTKWLLEATATDDASGIVLVEFYADDALVGSVTAEPYEFLVEAKIHTAQCIVYDAAGNSKMSDVITAFEFSNQQNVYLQQKLL